MVVVFLASLFFACHPLDLAVMSVTPQRLFFKPPFSVPLGLSSFSFFLRFLLLPSISTKGLGGILSSDTKLRRESWGSPFPILLLILRGAY